MYAPAIRRALKNRGLNEIEDGEKPGVGNLSDAVEAVKINGE